MQLASTIKDAIKLAGGTQAKLAEASGLSQQYISKLLAGKTTNLSLDAAVRICRATDQQIKLSDLAAAVLSPEGEVV